MEGPDPTLDESLFHVLYGVSLSLSSISSLLQSPWGTMPEGDAQRTAVQLQVGSKIIYDWLAQAWQPYMVKPYMVIAGND